ncbi:hypothetical protein CCGE525_07830 [Rhizobium jaguaris]|uniref:Uncharacterized protein n=1 Tax=Rhizobium jaguaris TaxID=1312183 RepID=A0A387FML2_9HYPH|nr:hypothetical protein CCGE525_07830 [Rhizobium jaguaris]
MSDGVRPMQLYSAGPPILRDGAVRVDLALRPANFKPSDRSPAEQGPGLRVEVANKFRGNLIGSSRR